jgi:ABC-2 type transport system permease protein
MKPAAISLYTIARKEVIRIFRIWPQTLLPSPMTMSLYLLVFGQFLGTRIRHIEGTSYLDFIVPGLIMMAVITNSYTNVVSSFFSSKFHRNVDELLVSPTPVSVIILGFVFGGMARGLTVGLLVTLVSTLFTTLHVYNPVCVLVFLFLTSFVFALGGLANGILARTFDDISIVPTFVIAPLTYLGGVFYSLSVLPPFWRAVSLANPIMHMVNGFRYGFLGIADVSVMGGLAVLITCAVLLFGLNLYLLKNGVGLKS